jgi:hypothetical protein
VLDRTNPPVRAALFVRMRQRRGAAGDSKPATATQAIIGGESDFQVIHYSPCLSSSPLDILLQNRKVAISTMVAPSIGSS